MLLLRQLMLQADHAISLQRTTASLQHILWSQQCSDDPVICVILLVTIHACLCLDNLSPAATALQLWLHKPCQPGSESEEGHGHVRRDPSALPAGLE